ncbi:M20/M25/M40 family metallo-hydrolase [Sphingomonas sp. ID0503]|uniref:M20/M25/M40 family metallo-hydrolase n=1 Tax=Sphingomonas sp. ID0503 TaxID=3399691 RepID=UPI003AFA9274
MFRPALTAIMIATALPAFAAVPQKDADEALDILKRGIAFRTVEGQTDQFTGYAAYLKSVLTAAGFAEGDVTVTPIGGAVTLVARYAGTDATAKPIVLSGHMDVVEAKRADWERDPFVPVVEGGYVYGRGSLDNKYDVLMMVEALVRLKRAGFKPRRDLILALSGDEETGMVTSSALAEQFRGKAEMVLNGDAGGGTLGADGKPLVYALQAGEKTYADFDISIADEGGHSSRPGASNAIYSLAKVIDRIAAFQFPPQSNELTRTFFNASAKRAEPKLAAAMRAFAANPEDAGAAATLSANPEYVGQVRTTCVATMLNGGHAHNALPQKATVSVNCRIFPGVAIDTVKAKLLEVAGDPKAVITTLDKPTASDASPLRPDVMAAVKKAVAARYPGLEVVPQMSAGATDSLYFRAAGLPSYGVGTVFLKPEDDFSHGLNERVPVAGIAGSLAQWDSVLRKLGR